jgi:hypothetical protein
LLDIVQPSVDPNVYCGECGPGSPDGITSHNLVDNICPISVQSSWINPAGSSPEFINYSSSVYVNGHNPAGAANATIPRGRAQINP